MAVTRLNMQTLEIDMIDRNVFRTAHQRIIEGNHPYARVWLDLVAWRSLSHKQANDLLITCRRMGEIAGQME